MLFMSSLQYLTPAYLADLSPIKTCILDQPDPKLHSGSTVYCTHAAGLIQTPTAYPVDWGSVVGLERCQLSWYRFTRGYQTQVYRVQN